MADIEKGLPVRTEDDADQKVQVKIVDSTDPDAQQAEVDADNNLHVEAHGNDPAGNDQVLKTSEDGDVSINGEYDATDNTEPSNIGLIGMVRNASPADSQATLRVTGITNGAGDVRALDVAIRDESGEPFSGSNPMPVTFEESEGDEIHDYNEGVDVAANGGTSNHDYSVADGRTFLLQQVLGASSTRFRIELQIGDGAASEVFATKCIRFGSEDTKTADIHFSQPIVVIGTVDTTTVRVIRRNDDDDDAASIYTTIVGLERNT